MSPQVEWYTDVETRGSDHIPTYVKIASFSTTSRSHAVKCTNWQAFEDSMEISAKSTNDFASFSSVLSDCQRASTKMFNIPRRCSTIDIEYERLRAVRRQAERRYRRTKDNGDLRNARKAQRHIRRHFMKLGRKRWRSFSSTLDPRKPLCKIWSIARGLKSPPQQRHPFRALALSIKRDELTVAENF